MRMLPTLNVALLIVCLVFLAIAVVSMIVSIVLRVRKNRAVALASVPTTTGDDGVGIWSLADQQSELRGGTEATRRRTRVAHLYSMRDRTTSQFHHQQKHNQLLTTRSLSSACEIRFGAASFESEDPRFLAAPTTEPHLKRLKVDEDRVAEDDDDEDSFNTACDDDDDDDDDDEKNIYVEAMCIRNLSSTQSLRFGNY